MIFKRKPSQDFKYTGTRAAMDGNTAVIHCERESSDAAGAYPITPSTQMGEMWAEEVSKGHVNISDRSLVFIEPESEHAAAAVTAGLAMTGMRAINFSSAQGVAFMHESLYAAAGKRLPYILNVGCRAITKAALNVHASHDDYHCVDDTGFFQVFAKNAQEAADLNIISHKVAELALNPGIVGQDGFLTTHLIESMKVPERELIAEFLGRPDDMIDCPTPAQRMIYGEKRRRIPATWDVDNPMVSGALQNQDSYMQQVAAQRPYFYDHVAELTDQCMEEFYQLTGRRYNRAQGYRTDDADYLIVGQGSMVATAEAVADYLRETRGIKLGVVNITMFRPFPGALLADLLKGRKGVAVLERTDQPLAEDLPLMRETRSAVSKAIENGVAGKVMPYAEYPSYRSSDIPRMYSGAYGLGSRDLQPEGLIAAVENMLPNGSQRTFFYLSVDFIRDKAASPKQELHQQAVEEAYPKVRQLALRGSENPSLMPDEAIAVRLHSVGGWGAMTTGKNLAMTLFDLLDFHIKANPKYGSEKKGQPTTYYLAAAPEPIRVSNELKTVDVVLSPDPNVFDHSDPLAGLVKGGAFIIQSSLESQEAVWQSFPPAAQRYVIENEIRVFYVDAFKIARDEASNADLQFRMQGIAFQGAFFAASPVMKRRGLTEETLFKAIEDQLQDKFGGKGARVVQDNLRVVRRGFEELTEVTDKVVTQGAIASDQIRVPDMPVMLKRMPQSSMASSDIHRFWEQTGSFYVSGQGNDNLADPFIAQSMIPASTGIYRDMTQIRFDYPEWKPEKCTACGDCYTVCPDSAIPGLTNTIGEVFDTAVRRIEIGGKPTRHLRRAVRDLEKRLRNALTQAGDGADVRAELDFAITHLLAETELAGDDKVKLEEELGWLKNSIGDFQFAVTKPYFGALEKRAKGSGGLFSLTLNPYTCKGCMECVEICEEDALVVTPQTPESVDTMRRNWDFWMDLPTTRPDFIRIEDLDEGIGALETLLLDKKAYGSMNCGDSACLGCGEKTTVHLFTATVTALMQPRVKAQVKKLDDLIERLEQHVRLKLAEGMDLSNVQAVNQVIGEHADKDLTLARLSTALDAGGGHTLDPDWLQWTSGVLAKLKDLRWRYLEGPSGRGRTEMGVINATGCTSVWGSTFPYSPYPFPWASHLFQDTPSMAMGIFEGHMAKMAEGFKAIRQAELELAGKYDPLEHEPFFSQFNWEQFSDEEFHLCPPVVGIGGDGAMYDIGFQNLSRALMSGMPIKVLVLDTQVYSNTGGQACTSGFISQVSDMAPYGKAWKGKEETRKEISLIGMAHRTSYVMQGAISNVTHLLESFIEGLNSRRPAMFNVYAVCPPEHGVGDDVAFAQSKLAVESRAYPLFRYNPDRGVTFRECSDLEGNPAMDADWPTYTLKYQDENGEEGTLELPMTFADFALTEGRFRKHFRKAPQDTWNDDMLPLHEFLDMSEDEREGRFPYIWTVDDKNRLGRVLVSEELVRSAEERRDFWKQLKGLLGLDHEVVDADAVAAQTRTDMAQRLSAALLSLASGEGNGQLAAALEGSAAPAPAQAPALAPAGAAPASTQAVPQGAANPANDGGNGAMAWEYEPVWVETNECTACDECLEIAPGVFAYDDNKQAVVVNPKGGSYKDIVRAAEKCAALAVHPGTPANAQEPDAEKLMKRAAKFN
ncbi:2-oxoacid:acceptor oxidoreductase family protein [Ectothiorhodospira variabilis]|uniref:2-oxoacid:acceptor oxidoreductase family protein n=1 Tax=Ectothiorhodospira variabilis TaxID=505694 RepID=UPI001EFBAB52|nr:2-oxoacid:acceptor oxidoreductase family protein [Ectothiorhodospira variabilis]MCG5495198.1 2-oxoacid:acceptor oxidoreductase family protein [Ectothiorhodospira variabilis]MCG5504252.1 2-oxoacid:acceptor oxidoreductase family protein [Ectothiorhodospira variabilis]MCG5507407.1 2-oxoacid:acceptor oxidoreductase family protein [Ectothiorhodospira variabilis]